MMIIKKFWEPGKKMQYRVRYAISAYFIDRKRPCQKNWEYSCDGTMYLNREAALTKAAGYLAVLPAKATKAKAATKR